MIPGAEPYFFSGTSRIGCLVMHGFTSSPGETRWLGQALNAAGFPVLGVRTAGHGTTPEDLARMRWTDWLDSVRDGYHLLRGQAEQIVVVGHSVGGVLSLLLAAEQPVLGAAILAAPMHLAPQVERARWLKYFVRFSDQTDRSPLGDVMRAEQQRRGEPVRGRIRYDLWPTFGVAQMVEMVAHNRTQLDRVRVPVLAVYSRVDRTVQSSDGDFLKANLVNAPSVDLRWLERSGHNLPVDIERETVFQWVVEFVESLSRS